MPSPDLDSFLRCCLQLYFACRPRQFREFSTGRLLTAHQAAILDHLDETASIGVRELARHMGVTDSTMSLQVERLVRDGFVLRQRDEQDARRVALRLTPSGARIRHQQKVLDPERVQSLLDRLSPSDRLRALEGLEVLARVVHETAAAEE